MYLYIIGAEDGPVKNRTHEQHQQAPRCHSDSGPYMKVILLGKATITDRDTANSTEVSIHAKLRTRHLYGEWFNCSSESAKSVFREVGLEVDETIISRRSRGLPSQRRSAETITDGISPSDFSEWIMHMREIRGVPEYAIAELLDCGKNQITEWRKKGAPRYIGLACASLAEGVEPWSELEFRGRAAALENDFS